MTAPRPVDDLMLSAWLDGELDSAESEQVEAWLKAHPEDAERVRRWADDRDALHDRLAPLLHEPVPERIRQAVLGRPVEWRRAALAAGLLLAGGLIGAGVMGQLQKRTAPAVEARAPAPAPVEWVQRASVAHAVFAPEVRHPVEVDTRIGNEAEQRAQEEHLARWLTKRLDMPVRLFDLQSQGFELVGGRLLPDAAGPSAQLMYQHGNGQRVTVYLRKPDQATPAAFRYERQGELGMFYWVEGPTGYALVGALPKDRLLALAESVYQQCTSQSAAGGASAAAAAGPPAASTPVR